MEPLIWVGFNHKQRAWKRGEQPQSCWYSDGFVPLMSAVCACSGDVRVLLSAGNTNTHQSPTAVLMLCLASNLAMQLWVQFHVFSLITKCQRLAEYRPTAAIHSQNSFGVCAGWQQGRGNAEVCKNADLGLPNICSFSVCGHDLSKTSAVTVALGSFLTIVTKFANQLISRFIQEENALLSLCLASLLYQFTSGSLKCMTFVQKKNKIIKKIIVVVV